MPVMFAGFSVLRPYHHQRTIEMKPVETGSDSKLPAFDRKDLLSRINGREDMVARIVKMFRHGVAGYLTALKKSLESGDSKQIKNAAHSIKGSTANISAMKMHATAVVLDSFADSGDVEACRSLIIRLENEFAEFCSATELSIFEESL
jgi:HPt (histidine-containing phosphotransfer) domain-containing protein